jgi:DNA-binding NarL/FixJ family response regulator
VPDPSQTRDFVGRSEELATIDRAIAAARQGVPSILLVGGDAGIGKSTLVSEAVARADVMLYLGRCVHIGGDAIPLAPLADLLRQVRRCSPLALAESAEFAVLTQWATPSTAPQDAAEAPGGLFAPVLDLLGRLAGEDAVVVGFEDLHWADAVTWDLFEFLARNLVDDRVVLVGTYRANEVGDDVAQRRRLAELSRQPAVHRVHLRGLGREEVTTRVQAMIGGTAPTALVDEVLVRGEGNPFFTEELVAAHLAGDAIPTRLSDLISGDVAGLSETTRRLLGAVAAVGRGTSHDLLTRVADLDGDTVEAAVRAAVDAHVVVVDRDTDDYRFRHALIGEVVYADLLPPERKRLHRRIADALREQPAHSLARADRAGELAFHLDRAGDHVAAFGALLAAADAAETVAPASALRHLERALELWDEAGEGVGGVSRGDRMWQAAELANTSGDREHAVDLAREAFAHGPPPRGEPFAHERLGRYLWATGQLEESAAEYEHAAALLSSHDGGPDAASVFAGLGQAELMLCHYSAAERWCRKVFELVPTPDVDPLAWVMARRVLGLVRSQLGHPDEAVELCREALAATSSAQTRALAVLYLANALLDAGWYGDAVTLALDGVADGQLAGLDRNFGGYLDALAVEGLTRLGRWSEAETVLARHAGNETFPAAAVRLGRAGAMLAARRGEHDRARSFLAQAESHPIDPLHRSFLDWAIADVHLILGDATQASVAAERGWQSNVPPARLWSARFAMVSVGAAVEGTLDALARREAIDVDSRVEELQRRIDTVRAEMEGNDDRHVPIETEAHLAHAAAMLTRLTTPDPDAWAEAARCWEQLSDRWAIATARLREAEAAASTGAMARAAESLQEAHRVATDLGAAPILAEAAAVSRRTRLSVTPTAPADLDEMSMDRLGLTSREVEVLSLVSIGKTNRQIGEALFVSEKTASVHVSHILRKLGVTSRVDAAAIAQRIGGR